MVCIFVFARMYLCMFLYSSVRANVFVCMCARVSFFLHEVTNSRNRSKICFNRGCAKESWNSRCCLINFDACILKHFVYALLYINIEQDRAYAHTRWCKCTQTHTHTNAHAHVHSQTLTRTQIDVKQRWWSTFPIRKHAICRKTFSYFTFSNMPSTFCNKRGILWKEPYTSW